MSIYMSRESSMSTMAPDLMNEVPEDLLDEQLVKGIDLMTASNRYLDLENQAIEMYLSHADPELLKGIEALTVATKPLASASHTLLSRSNISIFSSRRGTGDSTVHRRSSVRPLGSISLTPSALERGPRINMSNKEDIVSHETDELRTKLEKLHISSTKKRANLKAVLEETQLSLQEVYEAHTNLELVAKAIDPITGRIPAEKFVRHMEEWVKRVDSMVEKLRLRTSTLHSTYLRVTQQLEQKEELGERLHPVDFEQLKIENKQLTQKVEQKNRHLLELKKMAGHCSLQLANQKKKMQEQAAELTHYEQSLTEKEAQIKVLEKEADAVEEEVQMASQKLDSLRQFTENCKAPDVLEYIKKKAELSELNNAIKVWSRRKKIQHIALAACTRVLQGLAATRQTHGLQEEEEEDAL